VVVRGETKHTLYIASDNDFLSMVADPLKLPGDSTRKPIANPSWFYVFSFSDYDLPGYVPQRIAGPWMKAGNNQEYERDNNR
jgi:hypothetical protein